MTTHLATIRTVHRDITYIATPADLMLRINHYRNRGLLVSMTTPEPADYDGYFQTVLRLRVPYDPAAERAARNLNTTNRHAGRTRRSTRIAVIVTATFGITAGLVAVVAYLLGQLVEFITAHVGVILGVLVLAAMLAAAAARRRPSGSRHCPGC